MIRAVQAYSRKHSNYINMYNEITSGGSKKFAEVLAKEIETVTSKAYSELIEKAMRDGDIRSDINPRMFAFFFDNLLTMMQFSYSCDYYKERMKIFCGEDVEDRDEEMISQLLKFLESAFTFNQSEVIHK
ncbi:hypothetical protein D3C73_1107470 [compost metagenome]